MGEGDFKPSSKEGAQAPDCSTAFEVRQRLTGFRFPPTHRLTGKAELTAVLREGKRTRTKLLDVRAIASPLAHPRVGIVVPKRRRTTIDRNRLKRRLREVVRLHVLPVLQPLDLVISARPEAYDASFVDLQREVLKGIQRHTEMLQRDGTLSQ